MAYKNSNDYSIKTWVNFAKSAWGNGNEDVGKRAFVRAVFALIEGGVFSFKIMALRLSQHGKGNFTKAELAILEEEAYDLNDKRIASIRKRFIPLTKISICF